MATMKVPISGQVTGSPEADNLAEVAMSGHYAAGRYAAEFERRFADFMGRRECILVNSGSSANLLAMAALELPKGSAVATCAVNFPTTVSAIYQCGLIPFFVDADPKTLGMVKHAEWNGGHYADIRAMIVAHTLGNPCDAQLTRDGEPVPMVEDCCDALGSRFSDDKLCGQRGDLATVSFYPAHHITMGEGGAILTDSPKLRKIIESYRDWGRDCWCEPGRDNTCGTRFAGEYDHKYTYSRIGYNLKITDLQAAVGVAQLDRLEGFIEARRQNWWQLHEGLADLPIEIVEPLPDTLPAWFGFAFLTPDRNNLARYLDDRGVGNRPIMGGNLTRQPAFKKLRWFSAGDLPGADMIHEQGMWVGCWPGLDRAQLDYTIEVMHDYF